MNACLHEHVVTGSIARQDEVAALGGQGNGLWVKLDDDKGRTFAGEDCRHLSPDLAVPAENDMVS